MITTVQAWQSACNLIPDILQNDVGLTNGIKLSPSDRVSAPGIMFWELRVVDLECAKKQTYVTWRSDRSTPTEYADGSPLQRAVSGRIEIFSNNSRTDSSMTALLANIDDKFSDNQWAVELVTYEFDEKISRFHYVFEVLTIITG